MWGHIELKELVNCFMLQCPSVASLSWEACLTQEPCHARLVKKPNSELLVFSWALSLFQRMWSWLAVVTLQHIPNVSFNWTLRFFDQIHCTFSFQVRRTSSSFAAMLLGPQYNTWEVVAAQWFQYFGPTLWAVSSFAQLHYPLVWSWTPWESYSRLWPFHLSGSIWLGISCSVVLPCHQGALLLCSWPLPFQPLGT